MERLIECCAGLDVHRDTVAACVRVPDERGGRRHETRTFTTTTNRLLALRDWLQSFGVTLVGMESTGVYWKPVYYLLEPDVECWLLNARHLRNVPGAQDRRQGRRVDRPTRRARSGATELRAAAADPRAARPDSPSQGAHPGTQR